MSVGFIIEPLSIIDIAISVDKFALSIGFVLTPVAIVFGSVRPLLGSSSISEIIEPLSLVDSSVLQSDPTADDSTIFIWLLVLHAEILVGVDAVIVGHHLIHASVEAIVLQALTLELVELAHVSAHHGRVVIVKHVLFERRGRRGALDLRRLDLLGIVRAIAAVIRTTTHFK